MDESVDRSTSAGQAPDSEIPPEKLGHPRGTLVIVIVYALLFALGWACFYLFRFVSEGAPS